MASVSIAGRYALYKAGTQKVVKWLSETSQAHGWIRQRTRSSITTSELLVFAKQIASAEQAISVPFDVVEVLVEVIDGRKDCAYWYESDRAGSRATPEAKRSHRYFIAVLEEILDLLQAARRRQRESRSAQKSETRPVDVAADAATVSSDQSTTDSSSTDTLSRHLAEHEDASDLEDEQTENDQASCAQRNTKESRDRTAQPRKASSNLELQLDEAEEAKFAIWCFIRDCHDVRSYVSDTWREFTDGSLSFVAAIGVMDTSFGILRRANKELAETYSCLSTFDCVLDVLGVKVAHNGASPRIVKSTQVEANCAETLESTYTEILCPEAAFALSMFTNAYEREQEYEQSKKTAKRQAAKARKKGTSTESQTRPVQATPPREMTDEEVAAARLTFRYHPFVAKLFEVSKELRMLRGKIKPGSEHWTGDEFVDGVFRMGETLQPETWLVFACQIYMDTWNTTFSRAPNLGLIELQVTADDRGRCARKPAMRRQTHDFIVERSRQLRIAAGCQDHIYEEHEDRSGALAIGRNVSSAEGRYWIAAGVYQFLPSFSGTTLFYHKCTMHTLGVYTANDSSAVIATAHLYDALRQYKLLTREWKDMDWFIALQSKHIPFVKPLPDDCTGTALRKRLATARGLPGYLLGSSAMYRFSLRDLAMHGDKKQDQVEPTSDFLRAMFERKKIDFRSSFSRGETIDIALKAMHKEATATSTSDKSGRKQGGRRDSATQVTSLQLLSTFKRAFVEGEPDLQFDYITFWCTCRELLDMIRDKLSDKLPYLFKDATYASSGFNLVAHLFADACVAEEMKEPVKDSALGVAANLMRIVAETGSDKLSTAAMQQSSGHIPAYLHPMTAPKFMKAAVTGDEDSFEIPDGNLGNA